MRNICIRKRLSVFGALFAIFDVCSAYGSFYVYNLQSLTRSLFEPRPHKVKLMPGLRHTHTHTNTHILRKHFLGWVFCRFQLHLNFKCLAVVDIVSVLFLFFLSKSSTFGGVLHNFIKQHFVCWLLATVILATCWKYFVVVFSMMCCGFWSFLCSCCCCLLH